MHARRRGPWAVIVGLMAALLPGCAQPPIEQLEAAQKAVQAARAAEAETYAKEEFVQLEQSFNFAKEEIARKEKTLALLRSYSDADKMLRKVAADAKEVESKAVSAKEAAKNAAVGTEQEAQQAVVAARELLATAPVGKQRAAVKSFKQDMQALESGLGSIHQLIEKGEYREAEVQAQALKEKGAAATAEIQQAIDKVKGKRTGAHAS